ncbi:MAG: hypothetical protein ACFFD4_30325 [Candidatus Odinarchaeota archaeon]
MSTAESNTLQTILLSIVESFSDYFYKFAENIFGKRPTTLNFDKVSVKGKIGMTGLQLVKVSFSTELGTATSALAVKIFPEENAASEVVEKIKYVQRRISRYEKQGIKTADVLFCAGPVVVMEGIKGDDFKKSPVPLTEKFRMAGRALAALHGKTDNPVSNEKNLQLLKMILPELPIDQNWKARIMQLVENHFVQMGHNRGGTVAMGDFHPGNVLYEIDLQKEPILSVHLIDPEFIELEPVNDRFEDITNFFFNRCIQEYSQKGRLFQSLAEIGYFIAGYNEIMAYYNKDLFDFYTYNSFNIHLAQRILYSIINLQSIAANRNYFEEQAAIRAKMVEEILQSPPIYDRAKFEPVSSS